ncbi:MAG: serine/threonine protein kinase [Planctomycetes bacterium]|nr:serine/threonine protein kinase [Planctomycetota bacterium]
MSTRAEWYSDPTTLLDELRRGYGRRVSPPAINGYDDVEELRRGGQGIVYRAVQRSTKRRVAIKVLLDGSLASETQRRRFEREVDLVAALRHPNIIDVYDSGVTSDGRPYLVMEYIEGTPLDGYLTEPPRTQIEGACPRRLDVRTTVSLFVEIADAVNYAHQRGVIHRDLKPSNIRVDPAGRPHILDFGLAKFSADAAGEVTRAVSATGQFLGSLPWASPEQAEGATGRIDIRTDVYSLGVLLFQALTGVFPYPVTGSLRETLSNIVRTAPPHPRELRREVDADLDTIVLKCLAKEPDRRYQTAGELAADLRAYLDGGPIAARRESAWYVLRATVRRHRLAAGAVVAAAVLCVGFAIAMAALYRDTRLARDAERVARVAAQDSAEEARRIQGFLESMLASVDPTKARGRDVSLMRELLEEASRRIAAELKDQPEIAAALHHTIGVTYLALGLYPQADEHLHAAWDVRRARLGEEHSQTLVSRNALGQLIVAQTRMADSEPFLRTTLELCTRQMGTDAPETLRARHNLAHLLRLQGKPVEAEQQLRQVLERRRRVNGPESRETLQTLSDLATLFVDQGRYAEGESINREVVETYLRTVGLESPDAIAALGDLGLTIKLQGRLADAEPLYRQALDFARRVLGERHPVTLNRINNLAALLHDQGKVVEAEALHRQSLEMHRATLGEEHRETLTAMNNLARSLDDQGKHEEAGSLLRQLVESSRRTFGERHPFTALVTNNLAHLIEEVGDSAQAEPLYRTALTIRREALGDDHPDTLLSMNNLAMLLTTKGETAEAEALMRHTLETRRRIAGPEALDTLIATNNLASLLEKAGRSGEAVSLYAEAVAAAERTLSESHWITAAFRGNYGRCLGKLGRFDEAEHELLGAYACIRTALGEGHAQTIGVVRKLAELYDAWDRPAEAAGFRALLPQEAAPP